MVINIEDLRARFAKLADARQNQGKVYPLSYLLIVILLARLCGQHAPTGIAEWVRLRQMELLRASLIPIVALLVVALSLVVIGLVSSGATLTLETILEQLSLASQ